MSYFDPLQPWSVFSRARYVAERSGLPGEQRGVQDAFRHALASADATIRYGERAARLASEFRESSNADTPSGAMDLQNDKVGRELAEKHGNMGDVTNELVTLVEKGPSHDPGRLTWREGDKPQAPPQDFAERTKAASDKAYGERAEPRFSEGQVDDDDLKRAEQMANTARVAPDGDPAAIDALIYDELMHRFLQFISSISDDRLDLIEAALSPNISPDLRQQRLLDLFRANQLGEVFPPGLSSDAVTPRDRSELMDWIRKHAIADLLPAEMLQPRWSDPAQDFGLTRRETQVGGGQN